ncbi:glycoside hydrolase family 26 protein [Celeribacter neptunius]|uniref:Endoglucanase n=1 Tax=Celeribacter neptunius TaxID=588602 RepID=A0A1I3PLG6_9RHOB|nr:glycosyl hydrolase [Celeribacter neptunius]SFJ22190.1 endoglucanase [Celeribacter neptunius]
MTLKRMKGTTGVAIALALVASLAQAAPPGTLPFGVYDPDGDFSADGQVVIEHLFLPWEDVYLPSLNDADRYAKERGRSLLVTLEPWTWSRSERNTAQYLRRGIEDGRYDANMIAVCDVLRTLDSPVTLRFAHEMDDSSGQFIWSGWEPETYISAYRHMIDVCRAHAPNINVMWSPLGDEGMEDYYPGDDYADLVGLTVFGLQAWDQAKYGHDRTFEEIFAPRYERAASFGKPVVVAELGYVGDQDYVDMWNNAVRQEVADYPSLVGVAYFNQIEVYPWPEGFGAPDWRVKNQVLK